MGTSGRSGQLCPKGPCLCPMPLPQDPRLRRAEHGLPCHAGCCAVILCFSSLQSTEIDSCASGQ